MTRCVDGTLAAPNATERGRELQEAFREVTFAATLGASGRRTGHNQMLRPEQAPKPAISPVTTVESISFAWCAGIAKWVRALGRSKWAP